MWSREVTTELADMSLEQIVSMLPEDEQNVLLDGRDEQKLAYDWKWNGRPSQLLPVLPQEGGDSWSLAVALAGRGFGKTLMGAQWIRQLDTSWPELGRDRGHMRFFLLGRTSADVRDVMLEGPSGLMNVWPPSLRDKVRWIRPGAGWSCRAGLSASVFPARSLISCVVPPRM